MTDSRHNPEDITAADRKADIKAIVIVFTAILLGFVHFASGWHFDF